VFALLSSEEPLTIEQGPPTLLLKNFSSSYYEAGHMMYIDEKSLGKLHSDVEKFMQDSMNR
jgi:carboxypeptidase C (cathepsin A)